MKITGLSSRMAAFSSPFPSAGVDGAATSSPGTWRNSASSECEWVGPSWWPPPPGIRITIGTRTWPLNMYGIAAMWLTIWSIASSEKLTVISSTTGRSPAIAAPTPVADDRVLGDRRVADPLLAELVQQALGDLEGALEHAHVLAHHEDGLVAAHLLGEGVAERLAHPHHRHRDRPLARIVLLDGLVAPPDRARRPDRRRAPARRRGRGRGLRCPA